MGIFQQRPEEPTEWAGLPSEPWEPRTPSEVLADAGDDDLGLFAAGASVSVPIELREELLTETLDEDCTEEGTATR